MTRVETMAALLVSRLTPELANQLAEILSTKLDAAILRDEVKRLAPKLQSTHS